MKCPYCGFQESKVIDSRPTDDYLKIKRKRECLKCKKRFKTHEIVETIPIIIVKKNNSREEFDKNKLIKGLLRACANRPVSINTIENIATKIENNLQNSLDKEISSKLIGEYAMEYLRKIDEVSYVRFASVYREFKDINTFLEELNKLLNEKNS